MSMARFFSIPAKQKNGTLEITGADGEEEILIIPSRWNGFKVSGVARSAFRSQQKLRHVTISEEIDTIDVGAFLGCSNLEKAVLPDSLSSIAANAFCQCTRLNHLQLPACLNHIGSEAFKDCRSLTEIAFSHVPQYVGYDCFLHTPLAEITSEGIVHISGKILLSYQGTAATLTIPDGIVTIAAGAFQENDSLKQVICPPSLRFIGEKAFFHCSSLKTVRGLEQVSWMGAYAFAECIHLQQILIPLALTEIPNGAFCGCSQAKQIYFPQNLSRIGSFAFAHCSEITGILLPEHVAFLGRSAFYGCSRLQSVKLPSDLQTAGEDIFGECSSLLRLETEKWTGFYGNFGIPQPIDLILKNNRTQQTAVLFYSDNLERFTPGGCARLRLSLFDAPEYIDFTEYDDCLLQLRTRTDQAHFILNRLLHPEKLSSEKQQEYERFICTYARESLAVIVARDMEDAAYFLCKNRLVSEENLTFAVNLAIERQKPTLLLLFMNYHQTPASADPLDDLFQL